MQSGRPTFHFSLDDRNPRRAPARPVPPANPLACDGGSGTARVYATAHADVSDTSRFNLLRAQT